MIVNSIFKPIINPTGEKEPEIKKFVSYIYYPYQGSPIGHSELEIEGNSYALTSLTNLISIKDILTQGRSAQGHRKENRNIRPLSHMIKRTHSKLGLPFFRFSISVTPSQLDDLRKAVLIISDITCSMGIAVALKQCADFVIPMPLALSPSASALYLTAANKLGVRRIYQIESYGNPLGNLSKVITAIAVYQRLIIDIMLHL